jgi:hypothetical protein
MNGRLARFPHLFVESMQTTRTEDRPTGQRSAPFVPWFLRRNEVLIEVALPEAN